MIHPPNTPANVCIATYKEWLNQQDYKDNTLRVYYSRIKQFLLFLEYANLDWKILNYPESMKEAMVLYLDFLKQSKGTARTINATVNALINFSHFLGMNKIHLKRERIYFKLANVLNLEEQEKFLGGIEQQISARDRALALVLFYTGLRIGDCTRLKIADVLSNNMLETKTTCDVPLSLKLSNGKSIHLNSLTELAMREWLIERAKLVRRCLNCDNTALWLTKSGQRLSISGVSFVLRNIGLQVEVTVSAERLRRTAQFELNNHGQEN